MIQCVWNPQLKIPTPPPSSTTTSSLSDLAFCSTTRPVWMSLAPGLRHTDGVHVAICYRIVAPVIKGWRDHCHLGISRPPSRVTARESAVWSARCNDFAGSIALLRHRLPAPNEAVVNSLVVLVVASGNEHLVVRVGHHDPNEPSQHPDQRLLVVVVHQMQAGIPRLVLALVNRVMQAPVRRRKAAMQRRVDQREEEADAEETLPVFWLERFEGLQLVLGLSGTIARPPRCRDPSPKGRSQAA